MHTSTHVVIAYLEALESGDMERAACFFSRDARYSHPPFGDEPSGSGRHEVVGRAAIRELFERRGHRPTRHEIESIARAGDHVHVAGLARGQEGQVLGSWTAVALLQSTTGEIIEYAAYASVPHVWATLGA